MNGVRLEASDTSVSLAVDRVSGRSDLDSSSGTVFAAEAPLAEVARIAATHGVKLAGEAVS